MELMESELKRRLEQSNVELEQINARLEQSKADVKLANEKYENWLESVAVKPVLSPFLPLLPAFERGDFHDCTIRVGCDLRNSNSSFKDFKCHKLILIACSPMFETMYFSNFREATLGRDDPILMDRIDPKVFERAMRFVYSQGQVKDFECVPFGIQLYKFAHEMQIELLVQALDDFFKEPNAEDVFLIFNLYQLLDNNSGLKRCKEVLEEKASEAINTEGWLSISKESISEFLSMDSLLVNEVDLLRALLRWAEFQSQQEEDRSETLMDNFLPGFRLIRFASLSQQDMVQLFEEKLGEMLSGDVKCSILMSIATQNWNLMPDEYMIPSEQCPRETPYSICHINLDEYYPSLSADFYGQFTYSFTFQINKKAKMTGLKYEWGDYNLISKITLVDPSRDQAIVGNGNPEAILVYKSEDYIPIESTSLDANTNYVLNLYFPNVRCGSDMFSLKDEVFQTSDGLTVTIISNDMYRLLECLLFEREKPHA